jgi:hypothetical protein
MHEVIWPLSALLAWSAFLYKVRHLVREPGSLSLRLICVMLACVALTHTLTVPSVYVGFERLVGVANISIIVSVACAMGFVLAGQRLLLHWVYPVEQARRRARPWQAFYVVALVAQIVLFALASVDVSTYYFVETYGGTPFARECILIGDLCVFLAVVDMGRLCWRYASIAGRRFLRFGLRCTGIGALSAAVYFPVEMAHIVARSFHITVIPTGVMSDVFTTLGLICALLIGCGLTIPAWGPRLAAASAWISKYRAHRQLHPLWLALYRTHPAIALHVRNPLKDPLWTRDLDYRLVRRVVEIRDGQLALRPYLSGAVARNARIAGERHGLRGTRLEAMVESATLDEAIRAHHHGSPAAEPYHRAAPGGADLAEETAWLVQVARARSRLNRGDATASGPHNVHLDTPVARNA